MGFGHQADLARRWPARRLSAPARATDGNAYGKGGTKAHKTDDKEIRNPLEGAAEGEDGQTALASMTIGDQSRVVILRGSDESVPGPLRDVQTVRHILRRVVVSRHRGRRGPRKVIMQHAPQALVAR